MGENAFHMVFQERWVFSPTRHQIKPIQLWAGYGELVGENSISPGKPCEMHIFSSGVDPDYEMEGVTRIYICSHRVPTDRENLEKSERICDQGKVREFSCKNQGILF